MTGACLPAADEAETVKIVVHPATKLRAHEAVMEAVAEGTCKAFDAVLMIFITSNMDNTAGDCTRKVETMAAKLGVSKSKIFETLARLKDAGLIERQQNFGRQLATAYLLGPAVQAFTRQAAKRSKPRPETCTRRPGSWTP